jgi:hypothetical protein
VVRLVSLRLVARGVNGWESPLLRFGKRLTSLYGPNGTGKTPVLQAIAFCLGFDVKFREDVREHCQQARLTLQHAGKEIVLARDLGSEFHARISRGGEDSDYFNELDFSRALFSDVLKMTVPSLIASNRQATVPYVSTLLPIFYVRQDGGYTEAYKPSATFISDQFVEMIRFAFGFTPKRSYTAQRDLLKAREELDAMQRRVVYQDGVVADLSRTIDISAKARLYARAADLDAQISDLRHSASAANSASDALQELLHAKEGTIRSIRREQSELKSRLEGIESIRSEIEGETRTLSLNEESKRVFESFLDICGKEGCGLFVASVESYAKNLLYLKDQIKDLEANAGRASARVGLLEERLRDEEHERAMIASKVAQASSGTTGHIVAATQALTRELIEVQQGITSIEQLEEERRKFVRLDSERAKIQDRIETLTNNARADDGFNRLRLEMRDLMVKWMDLLNTPNASREVQIDPDFRIRFGSEPIEAFAGSTRSRLILAIHAAIFEHYLSEPDRPFRFLILDTPKQQELDSNDLGAYLSALRDLCDAHDGQIVISASEYRHALGAGDAEWAPSFAYGKKMMYLGSSDL